MKTKLVFDGKRVRMVPVAPEPTLELDVEAILRECQIRDEALKLAMAGVKFETNPETE